MASNSDTGPAVSVIIPAYNVSPYIGEALDSVFAQTFADFEVIVVNDGSPDTPELEKAISRFRERIVYLRQENLGAAAARNNALRNARGRFVSFLDADDIWLPAFLEEMTSIIQTDEGYDLAYANALLFGRSATVGLTYMDTNPSKGEVTCESLLAERCNIITSGVIARKQPIIELGMFDEELWHSQDFDLWVRLAKRPGARITYVPKVLLKYRHRPGSLASDSIKSVESELMVLEKTALRQDLTSAERAALESTMALRRASVEVDRGKQRLTEGDFDAAKRSFKYAYDYYRSSKLFFVLLWLRISPRTLQRLYRSRAR
jgi:glycosyltransferase involved in cell wall biosynthesis